MSSNSACTSRVSEAARRLVEDEHAAPDGERARDLDELLRGRRQIADRPLGGDVAVAELGERGRRRRAHPLALHDAERRGGAAAHRLDAEHDVLHHAQVRRERQLLVDHRDAGAPRGERIARRVRRRRRAASRRRRASARRRESPSACSFRRRSGRRARRPRRRARRDPRHRARRSRRRLCARRASRIAARVTASATSTGPGAAAPSRRDRSCARA